MFIISIIWNALKVHYGAFFFPQDDVSNNKLSSIHLNNSHPFPRNPAQRIYGGL